MRVLGCLLFPPMHDISLGMHQGSFSIQPNKKSQGNQHNRYGGVKSFTATDFFIIQILLN